MPTHKETLDKVSSLVKLASDESSTEDERRNAALAAVKLMSAEKLTVVPQADLDSLTRRIEGAELAVREARKDASTKMLMGAALGFAATKFLK
jgi:hypothetical protein